MTLDSLRKVIRDRQKLQDQEEQQENSPELQKLINECRGILFYRFNRRDYHTTTIPITNRNCCFNHIIGLPKKGDGNNNNNNNNKEYPLFDYEQMVYLALEEPGFINTRSATEEEEKRFNQLKVDIEQRVNSKKENMKMAHHNYVQEKENILVYPQKVGHLAVLKSTGLGLTEFFLRYIAWICLKDDKLKGSDIIILTGPRQELSNDLILRLKNLFLLLGITFDTRVTTLFLNGVRIRAFPSDHLSAVRGLANVSMIYCDEASFFSKESQCPRQPPRLTLADAVSVMLIAANSPVAATPRIIPNMVNDIFIRMVSV